MYLNIYIYIHTPIKSIHVFVHREPSPGEAVRCRIHGTWCSSQPSVRRSRRSSRLEAEAERPPATERPRLDDTLW